MHACVRARVRVVVVLCLLFRVGLLLFLLFLLLLLLLLLLNHHSHFFKYFFVCAFSEVISDSSPSPVRIKKQQSDGFSKLATS